METTTEYEEYAYFRPGEILYLVSHEDDYRLNEQVNLQPDHSLSSDETIDASSLPMNAPSDSEMKDAEAKARQGKGKTDDEKSQLSFDDKINQLIEWSNQEAERLNGEQILKSKLTITRLKEQEIHFPGTRQLPKLNKQDTKMSPDVKYISPDIQPRGAFSIIPVEVKIPIGQRDNSNPEGYAEPSDLAALVRGLDNARMQMNPPPHHEGTGITLEVVSPNWLSSPCSELGGGGGPGTRPLPYIGSAGSAPYEFKFATNPNIEKLFPEKAERGKGVKVAILDTAPCLQDLAAAYELYYKVDPEKQKQNERAPHPLIESLLRPNGPLHVHPASLEELFRMRNIHLRDHNYNMTAHGLFVAGIINSIAPAAEIHLYEVLNPEGVGDLKTIAMALLKVAEEQYRIYMLTGKVQPLVINCSLVLNIPLQFDQSSLSLDPNDPSLPIVSHPLTNLDEGFVQEISDTKWPERGGMIIGRICDLLFLLGSRVIAAAGNDRKPEDAGRPLARYMAAFPSVQGVGALPKEQNPQTFAQTHQYIAASYSDLSDQPGKVGVATLGGEAGEGKGVLGLYVGEFPEPEVEEPDPAEIPIFERIRRWIITFFGGIVALPPAAPKNENHWAWWAGTSFATPILSGVIAAVMSHPNPPRTTEEAIIKLYQSHAIEESKTTYQEDLLSVTQG